MRVSIIFLLLLFTIAAFAQGEGKVKGLVKLSDGNVCANTQVLVKIGINTNQLETGPDGRFEVPVEAGSGTVEVPGASVPVVVKAGNISEVTVTVPLTPGVLLQVHYADNTAFTGYIYAAYHAPGGERKTQAVNIGHGRAFVPGVPADASELSLIFEVSSGLPFNISSSIRRIFPFTEQEEMRMLEVTLPAFTHARVTITDEKKVPLANKRLTRALSFPIPNRDNFWQGDTGGRNALSQTCIVTTDAQGVVDLGPLPAQSYTLTVYDGQRAGPAKDFTLTEKEDAAVAYTLPSTGRRIVQTVFDNAGKAVPNAEVTATYCWGGKAIYRTAASDAIGKVVWDDVPAARVIVYGPRIAAGVIPADATEVTAPLPAPVPEQQSVDVAVHIEHKEAPVEMRLFLGDDNYGFTQVLHFQGSMNSGEHYIPGNRLNLLVMLNTSPPQVASVLDAYFPYVEGSDRCVDFPPLTFHDGTEIVGSFALPDGKALAHVNRLQLAEVEVPESVRKLLHHPNLPEWAHQGLDLHPDGSFTMTIPFPGSYRLLVDLYDEAAPALPALQFDAKPGHSQQIFHLPAPFAMVPGGATLTWLALNAPATLRQFTIQADADTVPLFAPADRIFACWYQPTPNTRKLWTHTAGATWRTLPLRSARVMPKNPPMASLAGPFALLPPFPSLRDENNRQLPRMSDGIPFKPECHYEWNLWPGQYLIARIDQETPAITGIYTVPEAGTVPDTFSLSYEEGWPTAARAMYTTFSAPAQEMPTRTASMASQALLTFDVAAKPQWVDPFSMHQWMVPQSAHSMTLVWPGVGSMHDVPLPQVKNGTSQVTLPAFTAGVPLSGVVTQGEKDTPLSNTRLTLCTEYLLAPTSIRLTTDANGAFTVKNLPAGTYQILLEDAKLHGGWTVTIKEPPTTPLALHVPSTPLTLACPWEFTDDMQLWWCAANSTPRRLPVNPSSTSYAQMLPVTQLACFDLSPGTGTLWAVSPTTGKSNCAAVTLTAGMNSVPATTAPASLGLYFPLTSEVGLPGAVTLHGLGKLAGLEVTLAPFTWQLAPAFSYALGQVNAVPPGDYRVTVATAHGPVESTVSVGAFGGSVTLPLPR